MIHKKFILFTILSGSTLLYPTQAFAHVIVKPNEAGIASFQTFDMGVPSEKDMATTAIRLIIPSGVTNVMPNVKTGWKITEQKKGDTITEIDWTNGSIPSGQRDDFLFSAQVPATPTVLKWKAYQTYEDGNIVAWIQDQKGKTPYSVTKVINDLTVPTQPVDTITTHEQSFTNYIILLTVGTAASLVLSILALILQLRKKI